MCSFTVHQSQVPLRMPLKSIFVWINSFFLFSVTASLLYDSRSEVEPAVLEIKPVLRSLGFWLKPRSIWVDTSVFENAGSEPQKCSSLEHDSCLRWQDQAEFRITKINDNCEVHEMSTTLNKRLSVSFNLDSVQLYGGTEMGNQKWPTQKSGLDSVPFVTDNGGIHVVLERYWLTSAGQYVYVDKTVPLFVTQNQTTLLLTAELRPPYLRKSNKTILKYRYCTFDNAKEAHLDAISNVFPKPDRVPDRRMVQYPIWTTWAAYKKYINESVVRDFATKIHDHGFPNSALEMDEMWEVCFGSLTVDTNKFPDMRRFVNELKKLGFRVTLWAHPFINEGCEPWYTIARESGYLVKSQNGSLHTRWWEGDAAVIDFTNPAAAKWYTDRLKKLMFDTGIDSYKFDAGESLFSPQVAVYSNMADDHPDTFHRAYIHAISEFGPMIEVRTAAGVQDIGMFVRMNDRDTKWSGYLSFDTIIPTLLQINIIGYPFVLPDMIGGNAYNDDKLTEELFVRWVQMNVFMPAMQFSLQPWLFSSKAIEITKNCIDLHAKYGDIIYELMEKATRDGTPVNLPLWWIDPYDSNTFAIDSEFLLGEDILVAPIIEEGARARDIYLPKGTWKDENRPESSLIDGPVMLNNYMVGLDVLPYFRRIHRRLRS